MERISNIIASAEDAADMRRRMGAAALEADPQAGLAQLRGGVEMLRSTGAEIRLPFYYGLLAEVCALRTKARCISRQAREAIALALGDPVLRHRVPFVAGAVELTHAVFAPNGDIIAVGYDGASTPHRGVILRLR